MGGNTLPSAVPPNRDTAVMRESPAVPFIGGAWGFPAAASGDDERREEGEGVAAAGARVSPPVAWEGGDQRRVSSASSTFYLITSVPF